jgi:hypothetical protein
MRALLERRTGRRDPQDYSTLARHITITLSQREKTSSFSKPLCERCGARLLKNDARPKLKLSRSSRLFCRLPVKLCVKFNHHTTRSDWTLSTGIYLCGKSPLSTSSREKMTEQDQIKNKNSQTPCFQ